MRKFVYVCDRCKKEISDPIRIFGCQVNTKTDRVEAEADPAHNELCVDCFRDLIKWIDVGICETNYDAIIRLYREGKEIDEIEKLTGIPVAAVSKVVVENGLGAERYGEDAALKKGGKAPLGSERAQRIYELADDGMPYNLIAEDVGCHVTTVRNYLRKREAENGD